MEMHAANLWPGDIVTGIWSNIRSRYDTVRENVYRVETHTGPDGTRLTTIQTGPQAWQTATYCADTVVRVHRP